MSYNDNPMMNPDKYGVTVVGEADLSAPDYSFDLIAVLRDSNGGYYLGTDSGCSCPSPWESHTMEDFTGPLTAEQAREEATSLYNAASQRYAYNVTFSYYDREGFEALIARIV